MYVMHYICHRFVIETKEMKADKMIIKRKVSYLKNVNSVVQ